MKMRTVPFTRIGGGIHRMAPEPRIGDYTERLVLRKKYKYRKFMRPKRVVTAYIHFQSGTQRDRGKRVVFLHRGSNESASRHMPVIRRAIVMSANRGSYTRKIWRIKGLVKPWAPGYYGGICDF